MALKSEYPVKLIGIYVFDNIRTADGLNDQLLCLVQVLDSVELN